MTNSHITELHASDKERYSFEVNTPPSTLSRYSSVTSTLASNSLNTDYSRLTKAEKWIKRIKTRSSMIIELQRQASEIVNTEDTDSEKLFEREGGEEYMDDVIGRGSTDFSSMDSELVTWDGPDDPEHPRNWAARRKWIATVVVSSYTFVSPYSSSVISLGVSFIAEDFHIESAFTKALLVSIFVLAWAIGPMVLAPLSEMYGRRVMLNYSILVLLAFNFGCAFAQNTTQMLVFRFLAADGETVAGRFYVNLSRPIKLLLFHPMVYGLGSFMAFVYGILYLTVVTVPNVWSDVYGFDKGTSGLLFLPLALGYLMGISFWTWACDKYYSRCVVRNGGVSKPEFRLPMLVCSGGIIPLGLLWFGWSTEKHLHWIIPSIGLWLFGFGLIAAFQTIQSYLIHMNPLFAASSLGAASLFRSLFGFGFPLFANQMFARLNYGWGNTLCAIVALALGVPFPLFVVVYGEQMRLWANRRFEQDIATRRERNLQRLQALNEKEAQFVNQEKQ
ncbi:hypothetical protein BABINDRAFT_176412 [Babjeviella inositovora NRRL Y-12698]|uniref:Major facilitator superfamily (MFS) profile domain-containing protein n=1 Tax=Babjeviella inositovora NRRL Y-12698 TaxID=984486 RepID=A0A1E3QP85_9ASCO|nr:uncharacterized protein BABINDRAFT_176412 [Babjeviella inositovora NRRL Y-12698]ODQ79519.1 hypothetical protein BABINDRAFT_176412 [Babjeviella inositovora NRRL Y-12698]